MDGINKIFRKHIDKYLEKVENVKLNWGNYERK
jgi:hypothetical protein